MQLISNSMAGGGEEDEDGHQLLLSAWFRESRHVEAIAGEPTTSEERDNWRKFVRERMKTVSVALVLCLNIGVDPPDVAKPNPCAKLECWVDPLSTQSQKAMDKIGSALQKQYERWQPRARYKTANDPTVEEVKKLCTNMRRNAKEERVLYHYNGHGVPRPTDNGEIWVFNKNFTQYIPLSIYDLQTWMGHPSVYVWDCNSAGTVVKSFNRFAVDHEREWNAQFETHRATLRPPLPVGDMTLEQQADASGFRRPPNYRECIQLAACREGELLPSNADMPADLFTSTLTTPIKTSVLWYIVKNGVKDRFPSNIVDQIPGQLNDRRTLLGELNWIFTAITDTIAWNTLPRELFQKLFRQDLLVASLFRNFLLADRLMRAHNCRPLSSPKLPGTADHPLWEAWDYTLDLCLSHLQRPSSPALELAPTLSNTQLHRRSIPTPSLLDYTHSPFFIDQLQAFDVWLQYGVEAQQPPQQLPVVLQVLLSQVHRVRALELLSRFLDLGSWAVGFALSVGIFPYVLKLLQSDTKELRPWLSFIWAKILAVDPACQVDLVKDSGFIYFIKILNDPMLDPRKKIVPAFVTATLIENCYRPGQEALTQNNYVTICMELLSDAELKQCRMLRLWLLIGMGRLWADCNDARWQAVRLVAYDRVAYYLADPVPEVRAAAIYALGSLVSNRSENNEHATQVDHQVSLKMANQSTYDGSALVRAELAVALHWFVLDFEDRFATLIYELDRELELTNPDNDEDRFNSLPRSARTRPQLLQQTEISDFRRSNSTNQVSDSSYVSPSRKSMADFNHYHHAAPNHHVAPMTSVDRYRNRIMQQIERLESRTFANAYETIWLVFLRLAVDPMPDVAKRSRTVVDHINTQAAVIAAKTAEKMAKMKTPRKTTTQDDAQLALRPTFVVGSPATIAAAGNNGTDADLATSALQSQPPIKHVRSISTELAGGPTPSFHATKFTPKRSQVFGTGPTHSTNEPAPTKKALITTEFVAWCSKRFAQPLLDTLQGSAGDGVTDRFDTKAAASDWAHHVSDALIEHADRELMRLVHNRSHRMETQKFVGRNQRPASTLAFSHLRPHLCASDARTVTVWDWERATVVKGFLNHEVNTFAPDSLTFLETINPMTSELLITGTGRGVLRVWDTGLDSEKGHDAVKLVTAAQLVKDLHRPTENPNAVYHWEQERGVLVVAGDMRVCRLWDVHTERKMQDLTIGGGSKCVVTSISSDILNNHLVTLGCNDGSVLLFDVRMPTNESRITTLRHLQMSVVKVHMLQYDSKVRLAAGSVDGHVRVWEPRMYQDPVTSVSVSSQGTAQLLAMNVQSNGRLIACATSSPAVKIFDLEGKALSAIRYHDGIMGTRLGEVTSVVFHPYRLSLGVASRDSYVAVYGMP